MSINKKIRNTPWLIGNTHSLGRKMSDEEKLKRTKHGINVPHSHVCSFCNLSFVVSNKYAKYCSRSCTAKGRPKIKRYPRTDEEKKKISESLKGKYTKEKAYQWKEDRTQLKDDRKDRGGQLHREWSLSVKRRDGWKCKISNEDCNGRMESHHILPWKDYPELRYNLNNGICLCKKHHPRKRKDEINSIELFQNIINNIN